MRAWFLIALASALSLACGLPSAAQQSSPANSQKAQSLELTAAQRSQIAEQIISRWMGEVLKSPRGDVNVWSSKLRKVVATGDAANVLRASQMPSLDLVHAALVGGAVDDAAVKVALSGTASTSEPQAIGSPISDTTYTPLFSGRCRVASSLAIVSPLPAGVTRAIHVEDTLSYASQGGVGSVRGDGSEVCGIPNFATALAVSVSARMPSADGVLKVFASNRPNAAGNTIPFYVSAKGGAADLIVESCRTCATEIAILSTAQTDYIIDVIGYFMPPQATALQCVDTAVSSSNIPASGGLGVVTAPECGTGYTQVDTECASASFDMRISISKNGTCAARNDGADVARLEANRVCCRVPGR